MEPDEDSVFEQKMEDLGQSEAQLAEDEPEYEFLVDFALSMGDVRPGGEFNEWQTIETLRKYGMTVEVGARVAGAAGDWAKLMKNKETYLKGKRELGRYVTAHSDEIDRGKTKELIRKFTRPDNRAETKQTMMASSNYTSAHDVDLFFTTQAPEFLHDLRVEVERKRPAEDVEGEEEEAPKALPLTTRFPTTDDAPTRKTTNNADGSRSEKEKKDAEATTDRGSSG